MAATKVAQACYRKMIKYEYQLQNDYSIQIDIKPGKTIEFDYLSLSADGILTINKYYAWDGPSGPTIDTRDFMRGSLIHDALYQLMRLGALDYKVYRKRADELLREICIQDGMCSFRARYVYWAVHLFAEDAARRPDPKINIICVP
jgi:hypothetical protein